MVHRQPAQVRRRRAAVPVFRLVVRRGVCGELPPLVRVAGGRDTAANIRGARLKIIPGMGHDFPPALMAGIAVMIAEHCRSDHG